MSVFWTSIGILLVFSGGFAIGLCFGGRTRASVPSPKPSSSEDILFESTMEMLKTPEIWKISSHRLEHPSGIKIWIGNRPYADMTVGPVKFSEPQRVEMRKACDKVRLMLEDGTIHLDPTSKELMKIYKWETEK